MAPLLDTMSRHKVKRLIPILLVVTLVVFLGVSALTSRDDSQAPSATSETSAKSSQQENLGGSGADKKGSAAQDADDSAQASASPLDERPRVEPVDEDAPNAAPTDTAEPVAQPARLTIPEGVEYEPDTVLLTIRDGATADEVNDLIANSSCVAAREVSEDEMTVGVVRLEVAQGTSVEDAMNELAQSDEVEGAQPNIAYYAQIGDEDDLKARLDGELAPADESLSAAGEEGAPASDEAVTLDGDDQADPASDEATAADDTAIDATIEPGSTADAAAQPEATADAKDDTSGPQALEAALTGHQPNDPLLGEQWALASIQAYKAWTIARCEHKVGVAVFDWGPQVSHEDLKDNVVESYDVYADQGEMHLVGDHGTRVTGIVGATADNEIGIAGVSYNADLVVYNVFHLDEGNRYRTYSNDICDAYGRLTGKAAVASKHNVRVVNMSIATKGNTDADPALNKAIDKAFDAGIVTVCAAGNHDSNGYQVPYYAYPGDYHTCVSVVNLKKDARSAEGVSRSYSSNYNVAGQTAKNISAPGTSIMTTIPEEGGYDSSSEGTSLAAPQVSGVLALMFAANPKLTAEQAVQTLYATARPIGEGDDGLDRDYYSYGWGEVDAYEAVKAAKEGKVGKLPDISSLVQEPKVTGATSIPVGGKATYTVEGGTLRVVSGSDAISLSNNVVTGKKAGTGKLGVYDRNGTKRSDISVKVYATEGTWQLATALNAGYVMDMQRGSVLNGGNAVIYKNGSTTNQVWKLERYNDSSRYTIRNAKSGKLLDVVGSSTKSGANVQQGAPGVKESQLWTIQVQPDNSVVFVNDKSGKALEVDAAAAGNSKNVRQANKTSAKRQCWQLKKVNADIGEVWDGEYRISSKLNTGYVLDLRRSSMANGGNVILYSWQGGNNQRWHIQYLGKGAYRVYNVKSGLSLDVSRSSLANKANILQWSWNNTGNQRWGFTSNTDGSYAIVREGTSCAIAVDGTTAGNSRNIHQYKRGSAKNQRWVLQQF